MLNPSLPARWTRQFCKNPDDTFDHEREAAMNANI
jgi:hypothetical protein